MNPNASFEYGAGKRFWDVVSGTVGVDTDQENPPPGGHHLTVSAIYPELGLVRQSTLVQFHGNYDLATWVKRTSDALGGEVTVRHQSREWEPFRGSDVDCNLSAGTWLQTKETSFMPTRSWTQYQVPDYDPPQEHVQIKLVIENQLLGCIPQDPCRASIAVDHARARGL